MGGRGLLGVSQLASTTALSMGGLAVITGWAINVSPDRGIMVTLSAGLRRRPRPDQIPVFVFFNGTRFGVGAYGEVNALHGLRFPSEVRSPPKHGVRSRLHRRGRNPRRSRELFPERDNPNRPSSWRRCDRIPRLHLDSHDRPRPGQRKRFHYPAETRLGLGQLSAALFFTAPASPGSLATFSSNPRIVGATSARRGPFWMDGELNGTTQGGTTNWYNETGHRTRPRPASPTSPRTSA